MQDQEELVQKYESMVAELQDPHFSSKYVKVLTPGPGTPP